MSQPPSATTKVACDISRDFGAAQATDKKVESVDSQVGENPGTNQPNGTDSASPGFRWWEGRLAMLSSAHADRFRRKWRSRHSPMKSSKANHARAIEVRRTSESDHRQVMKREELA